MGEILDQTTGEVPVITPRVRALDYIGGEGGYCEPLVITTGDGEFYVLHDAFLDSGSETGMTHRKVAFETQAELEAAFDEIQRRLTNSHVKNWEETDRTLGFDVEPVIFTAATGAIRMIPWDQRRSAKQ